MLTPHIIIVADTGTFRAFELEHPPGRDPFPREIEAVDVVVTNQQLHEKVTDQAGAMSGGGALGNSSHVGDEGIQLEDKVRAIKEIGGHIDRVLSERKPDRWAFAAPSEVNQSILDAIPNKQWKDRLRENLSRNLTNVRPQEFGKHFQF
jgi:hypothetical protein